MTIDEQLENTLVQLRARIGIANSMFPKDIYTEDELDEIVLQKPREMAALVDLIGALRAAQHGADILQAMDVVLAAESAVETVPSAADIAAAGSEGEEGVEIGADEILIPELFQILPEPLVLQIMAFVASDPHGWNRYSRVCKWFRNTADKCIKRVSVTGQLRLAMHRANMASGFLSMAEHPENTHAEYLLWTVMKKYALQAAHCQFRGMPLHYVYIYSHHLIDLRDFSLGIWHPWYTLTCKKRRTYGTLPAFNNLKSCRPLIFAGALVSRTSGAFVYAGSCPCRAQGADWSRLHSGLASCDVLRSVNLNGCTKILPEELGKLQQLKCLEIVDLRYCLALDYNKAGFDHLLGCKALQTALMSAPAKAHLEQV